VKILNIKKIAAVTSTVALMATNFVFPAFAAGTDHFGPFSSTTIDGGSCGVDWANDVVNREFTVHDNGDGTFKVTEQFKDGTFTTMGTTSPGKCETTPNHGSTVATGIVGNFQGSLSGSVTSSTYNPNACTQATCNSTQGFLTTVLGPGASLSGVTFNFEYNSNDKSLKYHHWQDKSDNTGADKFEGDIANN
jgi:hypothetical protein